MPEAKTFDLAGLTWEVRPLGTDEQLEVECIVIRTFGPSVGAGIAALVQGLAPALIEVLRETAGEGEAFDLSRLGELDTSDPRIALAWGQLLDALADTGGEVVRDAVGALAARLDHRDIMRLFDLTILHNKTMISKVGVNGGDPVKVNSYETLGKLLQHDPRAKWDLLTQAMLVTYGREAKPIELRDPPVDIEAETDGGE